MADTLNLPISEMTQRKLRALAMLTGEGVGSIESTLSGFLDEIITKKCAELLGVEQSVTFNYNVDTDAETPSLSVKPAPKKTFADAHKETAAAPSVEEAFSGIELKDEVSGHELSGDVDDQNNKSLEEQAEAEAAKEPEDEEDETLKKVFSDSHIKNAGGNAEAFLDAAMGEPEEREDDEIPTVTRGYAGQGPYSERPRKATKSFESRLRKGQGARIQAYTGEED